MTRLAFVLLVSCSLLAISSTSHAAEKIASFKIGELGLEGQIAYEGADGDKLKFEASWGLKVLDIPLEAKISKTLGKNSGGSYEFIEERSLSGVGIKFVFYIEPKSNGFRFIGRIEGSVGGKRVYIPGPNHRSAIVVPVKW